MNLKFFPKRSGAMSLSDDIKVQLDAVQFAKVMLDVELDKWQKRVMRYTGKRLLMLCCRQSGKSMTSAIMALHRALYTKRALVLLISPSLRQSGELFRTISDFSMQVSPVPKKIEDNRLSLTLENNSRIVSLPSKEATIRGFSRPDIVIIDEAARVTDPIYYAVRPMLATNPNAMLILLSTPNGKQGFYWEEYSGSKEWERIRVTATDCPRISKSFLREEKDTLGHYLFEQEYNIKFIEPDDELFNTDSVQQAMKDIPVFQGAPIYEEEYNGSDD